MSLQPSEEPYTTIARLRAEVERLQASQTFGYWRHTAWNLEQRVEILEYERDEALAQARALLDRLKNSESNNQANYALLCAAYKDRDERLLPRLQRAEAVVEAALQVRKDCQRAFAAGEVEGTRWPSEVYLQDALVAWEAGKA